MKLTRKGEEKVNSFIKNLEAKRKEILNANRDTANETILPTIKDILLDIEWFEEDNEYCNNWGITDNYNNDYPLYLVKKVDYID